MFNPPPQQLLDTLPKLYETENVPTGDKTIYLHFFVGPCDWYIAEYDGEDLFFGYANLGDPQMAEWGYISYTELREAIAGPVQIEWDEHWTPKPFREIYQDRPGMNRPQTLEP